jgi:methylated-DNA-[protein]-cysteine S-methyltransferase
MVEPLNVFTAFPVFCQSISGRHTLARAVGSAVGHNPVSILIPCRRVIGKNSDLTGYADGIEIKQKLVRLEGCL